MKDLLQLVAVLVLLYAGMAVVLVAVSGCVEREAVRIAPGVEARVQPITVNPEAKARVEAEAKAQVAEFEASYRREQDTRNTNVQSGTGNTQNSSVDQSERPVDKNLLWVLLAVSTMGSYPVYRLFELLESVLARAPARARAGARR